MTRSYSSQSSSGSIGRYARGGVFEIEVVDQRGGLLTCRVIGPGSGRLFGGEPGGHRWQRVPPTERHGRRQTSTVTVAVLPEPSEQQVTISSRDVEWTAVRGSGNGGQHRQMTCSAVRVRHVPTGIEARCEDERSQYRNRASAMAVLRARVWAYQLEREHGARASDRRHQVGSGQRGDKRRTIRVQDGQVHDHVTGRRWRLADYMRGDW